MNFSFNYGNLNKIIKIYLGIYMTSVNGSSSGVPSSFDKRVTQNIQVKLRNNPTYQTVKKTENYVYLANQLGGDAAVLEAVNALGANDSTKMTKAVKPIIINLLEKKLGDDKPTASEINGIPENNKRKKGKDNKTEYIRLLIQKYNNKNPNNKLNLYDTNNDFDLSKLGKQSKNKTPDPNSVTDHPSFSGAENDENADQNAKGAKGKTDPDRKTDYNKLAKQYDDFVKNSPAYQKYLKSKHNCELEKAKIKELEEQFKLSDAEKELNNTSELGNRIVGDIMKAVQGINSIVQQMKSMSEQVSKMGPDPNKAAANLPTQNQNQMGMNQNQFSF